MIFMMNSVKSRSHVSFRYVLRYVKPILRMNHRIMIERRN